MKSLIDPFSKPGHVIRRLQQIAVLMFHEETEGFGLTPTQYVTLQVLEHQPGIDQVTVSEATMIDRSMTARIVEALAQRGLIDKRTGRTDRRANALYITPKARRLLESIEKSADASQARILSPLRPAERRAFMGMVKKILLGHERRAEEKASAKPRKRRTAR
jgi:MarR family transcriptional regulator, lower aerobic nicotinate degradation pathway regulator